MATTRKARATTVKKSSAAKRASATGQAMGLKKATTRAKKTAARTPTTKAKQGTAEKGLEGSISHFDPATGIGQIRVDAREYHLDLSQVELSNMGYVQLRPGRKVEVTFDSKDKTRFQGLKVL